MLRITLALFVVLALTGVTGSAGAQVSYLGEACWSVAGSTPGGSPGLMELGVLPFGSGHFLLAGRMTDPTGIAPLHGNAEVLGSKVYMSLNAATDGPTASVVQVTLDLPGLGGVWKVITIEESGVVTDAGTAAVVACP